MARSQGVRHRGFGANAGFSVNPAPWRLVLRAIQSLFGVYNVKHYGAKGDGVTDDTAAIQRAITACGLVGGTVYFPVGIYMVAPPGLVVPSNVALRGAGRVVTILRSMSSYIANGPILSNVLDGGGLITPMRDVQIADMTIDGDYVNNVQFAQQAATTTTITSTDTNFSITFTQDLVTLGFPASGRIALIDQIGDNAGRVTYSAISGTHQLTGCNFVTDSSSAPFNAAIGTVFRNYAESSQGLVRFKSYERLTFDRVEVKNSGGYCIGLQGQPEESVNYTNGTWPKDNLTMRDVALRNSYNSDGLDIKEQYGITLINVEATDCHDKGINVRGRYQTYINVRVERNGTGFGLVTNRLASPEPFGTLDADATATATTLTVTTTNLPTASPGWLGTERISWTGKTGSTLTGVTRGLLGTRAAAWAATSSTTPVYVTADVAGADVIDGSVDMLGCWAVDNIGTGIAITSAGAGTTMRATVHGGGATGNNRGLLLQNSRGTMRASVHGGEYYGNGEGMRATAVEWLRVFGTSLRDNTTVGFGNGTGDGLYLLNCANGAELFGVDITGNTGYGVHFPANGNTDYVRQYGGRWRNNTLGVTNTPPQTVTHNSGPVFSAKYGFTAPPIPTGSQSAAVTANQARGMRFVAPYDITLTQLSFAVEVAAGSDDEVDVGISDKTGARLVSSGATTGKLNSTGAKTITVAPTELVEGGVYYAWLSTGTIGSTAAQLRMTSSSSFVIDLLGGGTGNRNQVAMSTAHPLPSTLTMSTASAVPIIGIRQ